MGKVESVSRGNNKKQSLKGMVGMISFDLMIFMLGIVMILYLCITVLVNVTYRTEVRMKTVSKYNWALEIADHLIKFGSYDDCSFNDHKILNEYDKVISKLKYKNVTLCSGKLGDIQCDLDFDDDRVCITRYGVMNRSIAKLIVCVDD